MNTIKKVSLEGTFAGKIDQASLIAACPQVRELNLSKTLIGSWVDVAKVGRGLPNLKSLRLDNDRVGPRLVVRFTKKINFFESFFLFIITACVWCFGVLVFWCKKTDLTVKTNIFFIFVVVVVVLVSTPNESHPA